MFFIKKKIILLIILIFNANLFSITLTILPFTSINEEWIKEYNVDDGLTRVLEESFKNTKMLNITDYDLLISYFSSYSIVTSYKSMVTNMQLASDFIKETFNSDYIITGEVLDFELKKGGKYTANVKFKINLLDINSLKVIKSFTDNASYTLPNNSAIYSSEDALFEETALGWASNIAFNKIVKNITEFLGNPPLTGIVTRVDENKLYINLGKKNNIKNGDEFNIYKVNRILEMPKDEIISITNNSNIPKTYFQTNYDKSYIAVRSNDKGNVWYTSEILYKYRHFKKIEEIIGTAKVIEIYDNYAVLENDKINTKIEAMMIVRKKNE